MSKIIVATILGSGAYTEELFNFIHLAESTGWRTILLGAAAANKLVFESMINEKADLVIVSCTQSSIVGEFLIGQFAEDASDFRKTGMKFVFVGPHRVAVHAARLRFFYDKVFGSWESAEQVLSYLKQLSN